MCSRAVQEMHLAEPCLVRCSHGRLGSSPDISGRSQTAWGSLMPAAPATAGISVAGVDGCPAGWFVVARLDCDGCWLCTSRPSFAEVFDLAGDAAVLAVDIPIGLLGHGQPGGRQCDRVARRLLGHGSRLSIFSAPSRDVLDAASHAEANARSKAGSAWGIGVSLQTFYITGRVREVDDALRSGRASQDRVREVHPELAFWEMGFSRRWDPDPQDADHSSPAYSTGLSAPNTSRGSTGAHTWTCTHASGR